MVVPSAFKGSEKLCSKSTHLVLCSQFSSNNLTPEQFWCLHPTSCTLGSAMQFTFFYVMPDPASRKRERGGRMTMLRVAKRIRLFVVGLENQQPLYRISAQMFNSAMSNMIIISVGEKNKTLRSLSPVFLFLHQEILYAHFWVTNLLDIFKEKIWSPRFLSLPCSQSIRNRFLFSKNRVQLLSCI